MGLPGEYSQEGEGRRGDKPTHRHSLRLVSHETGRPVPRSGRPVNPGKQKPASSPASPAKTGGKAAGRLPAIRGPHKTLREERRDEGIKLGEKAGVAKSAKQEKLERDLLQVRSTVCISRDRWMWQARRSRLWPTQLHCLARSSLLIAPGQSATKIRGGREGPHCEPGNAKQKRQSAPNCRRRTLLHCMEGSSANLIPHVLFTPATGEPCWPK